MSLQIRRVHVTSQAVHTEAGRVLDGDLQQVVAAAVLTDPWSGRGDVRDLSSPVRQGCPPLVRLLMDRALAALPAGATAAAVGKAVAVGTGVELEHGAALIHNPYFSDVVRDRVGGTSVLPSTEARGPEGVLLTVPLVHRTRATDRAHYQGVQISVPDAPHPDEIVVLVALSTGTRPDPRIGDRRTDAPFDPTAWRP